MNQWKEIWLAYHMEATRIRIFKDLWFHASSWDRFFTFFMSFVFLCSMILHFIQQGWWLLPTVISEISLLYKLSSLKQKLVLDEYGGHDNSQSPPNSDNHQDTRYLIFKSQLQEKHITKSHITDCFELIDSQIDIAQTDSSGIRKISTFSVGLLAGIFATLWKQLDTTSLVLIAISIIAIVVLISVIASTFLSKLEKLKELKYFMLLFCREML